MKFIASAIEFITELFYYIAEVYRRSNFKINHLAVYPVAFLYSEILLKVFAHTQAHVAYMLVFDFGIMCLATALTCLFNKTVNRILTIIVLTANGIYFGLECSLRQLDAVYETVIPLFQSEDIVQTFFEALPLILLFMIPVFAYLLIGSEHLPAVKRRASFSGILLLAFFVFTFMGSVVGAHGRYAPYYKSIDSFNESTEVFGLYTSSRLDLKWRFLGGGLTCEQVRAQSNTPETDIISPKETETTAEVTAEDSLTDEQSAEEQPDTEEVTGLDENETDAENTSEDLGTSDVEITNEEGSAGENTFESTDLDENSADNVSA